MVKYVRITANSVCGEATVDGKPIYGLLGVNIGDVLEVYAKRDFDGDYVLKKEVCGWRFLKPYQCEPYEPNKEQHNG